MAVFAGNGTSSGSAQPAQARACAHLPLQPERTAASVPSALSGCWLGRQDTNYRDKELLKMANRNIYHNKYQHDFQYFLEQVCNSFVQIGIF
jgi:hypothetical protein